MTRTVGGQKALSVALREGEPSDRVDLLLNLHRSQKVELAIVTLEFCVELISLLVRLLFKHDNLSAIVAHSQKLSSRIEGQRRDPVGN